MPIRPVSRSMSGFPSGPRDRENSAPVEALSAALGRKPRWRAVKISSRVSRRPPAHWAKAMAES